jgi:hypothetical protein
MIKTLEQLGYRRTEYLDDDGKLYSIDFVKEDITGRQRIDISVTHSLVEAYTINNKGNIDIEVLDFETIKAIDNEIQEIEIYKEAL